MKLNRFVYWILFDYRALIAVGSIPLAIGFLIGFAAIAAK